MPITIKILSASDRFNYGDLLFPIIAKNVFTEPEFIVENIAIKKTNLSDIGALPTLAYKELFKKNKGNKTVILVAGGDIFSVNWSAVYSYLNFWYNKLYWRISNKRLLDKLTRFYAGYPDTRNPFVPLFKRDMNIPSVIYHSVGGKPSSDIKTTEAINEARYFSVRDSSVQDYFFENHDIQKPLLTPDSAILMSNYFTFVTTSEKYIAFQMGHYSVELPIVLEQLQLIFNTTGYHIKLVPIGNCIGHADIISLTFILKNAKFPCTILENPSIKSIMSTIANAQFFAGTSLHGIITAMSFGVPYAGINPEITKLKNYLSTWAPEGFKEMANFSEIYSVAISRMKINKEILDTNAVYQKAESIKSFDQIIKVIR